MLPWRNSSRGRLKIFCLKRRGGASPSGSTIHYWELIMSSFLNEVKIATLAHHKQERDERRDKAIALTKSIIRDAANNGGDHVTINYKSTLKATPVLANEVMFFFTREGFSVRIDDSLLIISWR